MNQPVGRYYWESVVDGHFMAVPSEGTIHYEIDDFPLYLHPVKELTCNSTEIANKKEFWESYAKVSSESHPVKELTYEDGIEECAQRAESYAYMSPNFTALAEELRAILRKAQEK